MSKESALKERFVRITSFGQGRFRSKVSSRTTVGRVLREHKVDTEGRRVAVNGHSAGFDTGLEQGDEVTVVPRVEGG